MRKKRDKGPLPIVRIIKGEIMLEIRHLTKVYTTKGGAQTRALDDVSVSFGETET